MLTEPWGPLLRQGTEALLEGRFGECERLAGEVARLTPGEPAPGLLTVAAYREQGRTAEAEILLRGVLAARPSVAEGQALLGAVLADLGRDAEARRQLEFLDDDDVTPLPAALLAAEVAAAVYSPAHATALLERLTPDADAFVGWHGAAARHVGLLHHVLGCWDAAERSFAAALRANEAAGAPVLVAHTCRQLSALLRVRGEGGDWDRAIDLLARAAAIYRRLDIVPLAEQAEAVLRRSQDVMAPDDDTGQPPANVFRRTASGWDLAYAGQQAVVPDAPGLRHIATLLAADGRPVHAVDLVESPADGAVCEEYRARLGELQAQVSGPDRVAAAMARAERDFLRAELAVLAGGTTPAADVGDRARRLAALRIRTALDGLDPVLPTLAHHLRRSIRTGTFCLYAPERPERWTMGG